MFNDTALSLVLFRWAIFSLLVYKCYQITQQYILPWLQKDIKQEQDELAALINKDKFAMVLKQKIENQIYEQGQLLLLLEQNVLRWHRSLLYEKECIEKAQAELVVAQKNKHDRQQQHLFLTHSITAVLPVSLAKAEETLLHQYGNKEKHAHFDSIIAGLALVKKTGHTL